MSKYAGSQFSVFLVDGYNLAASIMDSVSMGEESITQETHPFGTGNESHTPIGIVRGALSVGKGFFDTATDALHGALSTVVGISRIVCAAIETNTIGNHFMGFEGAYSQKYTILDANEGMTEADVEYLVSGAVDEGVIVQHLATFTADWDTKTGGANAPDAPVDNTLDKMNRGGDITGSTKANPCVITTAKPHGLISTQRIVISGNSLSGPAINGQQIVTVLSATTFSVPVNTSASTGTGNDGTFVYASTSGGGVGYQQVPAFSGFTGFVGKIMHSPDDSTYAALVTFANVTAINNKQRLTASGIVDRYLSFNGDVTGSGSIDVFSGFARNFYN